LPTTSLVNRPFTPPLPPTLSAFFGMIMRRSSQNDRKQRHGHTENIRALAFRMVSQHRASFVLRAITLDATRRRASAQRRRLSPAVAGWVGRLPRCRLVLLTLCRLVVVALKLQLDSKSLLAVLVSMDHSCSKRCPPHIGFRFIRCVPFWVCYVASVSLVATPRHSSRRR
jgi:hypothetical protein